MLSIARTIREHVIPRHAPQVQGLRVMTVLMATVIAACGGPGAEPSRALRSGDAATLSIVLPTGATESLVMAADDLLEVVRLRTGATTVTAAVISAGETYDPAKAGTTIVVLAGVRPSGATALQFPVAAAQADSRTDQGYIVAEETRGGRLVLRVESPTMLGVAYGLYEVAGRLGATWLHPEESFVPVDPLATLPTDFTTPVSSIPAMDFRGYHQHTQHPIPFSDFLLRPREEWRPYVSHYFRWQLRNRQNGFQWHMLSTVDLPTWRDHARWVTDEAHRHGVRVGMVVAFADKQQNGFRLILDLGEGLEKEARILHQRQQVRQGLDTLWAMDLGLDYLHMMFATSEMTTISDAEVLAWFDELATWAKDRPDAPRLFAHAHIPGNLLADDGKTLFYHLPLRADPAIGLMVHTTMFYDLEHPVTVYGNKDFHHAQIPFVQGRGQRDLVYFPETAWWLGFDNNLPLFLPITGWARGYDLGTVLPGLMQGTPLSGHVTFTTGIEWTFWMYDHFLARATWDTGYGWERYVSDISPLFGPGGTAATAAIRAVTQRQVADFFGDNPRIFYYLAGESANDELGAPSGLVGRPVKVPFWDVFHYAAADFDAWKTRDFDMLTSMKDAYAAIAADLVAADSGTPAGDGTGDRFFELRSVVELLAWRAEHATLLYEAVVDARTGAFETAYVKLAAAREITQRVKDRVAQVETRVYRYPLELCAEPKPESPTAYPIGDLHETRTAHFWARRDDQLQSLLDVASGKVAEGFDAGFDTVYATDPKATQMIEPDVDEGMKSLLVAYVPSLLLAVAVPATEGVPVAVGEDLNRNGLPDLGTVVAGLAANGSNPWTFPFTVLPLAIGDSANPLGTLNLRAGTATVTLTEGVPQALELGARVDFKDLLDALESTGMFDQQTGWEMVAPLFNIDQTAEPRPKDFPMRFAAPLVRQGGK
jgi:hypothetical protein